MTLENLVISLTEIYPEVRTHRTPQFEADLLANAELTEDEV